MRSQHFVHASQRDAPLQGWLQGGALGVGVKRSGSLTHSVVSDAVSCPKKSVMGTLKHVGSYPAMQSMTSNLDVLGPSQTAAKRATSVSSLIATHPAAAAVSAGCGRSHAAAWQAAVAHLSVLQGLHVFFAPAEVIRGVIPSTVPRARLRQRLRPVQLPHLSHLGSMLERCSVCTDILAAVAQHLRAYICMQDSVTEAAPIKLSNTVASALSLGNRQAHVCLHGASSFRSELLLVSVGTGVCRVAAGSCSCSLSPVRKTCAA